MRGTRGVSLLYSSSSPCLALLSSPLSFGKGTRVCCLLESSHNGALPGLCSFVSARVAPRFCYSTTFPCELERYLCYSSPSKLTICAQLVPRLTRADSIRVWSRHPSAGHCEYNLVTGRRYSYRCDWIHLAFPHILLRFHCRWGRPIHLVLAQYVDWRMDRVPGYLRPRHGSLCSNPGHGCAKRAPSRGHPNRLRNGDVYADICRVSFFLTSLNNLRINKLTRSGPSAALFSPL